MFGWIIGLTILVVLIVVFSKGSLFSVNNPKPEADSARKAIEILKNRYARGEIDQSEYEEKKAELEKSN